MDNVKTLAQPKRHYWLRPDFNSLMGMLPLANQDGKDHRRSSTSLVYPKNIEGAYRELRLRGLQCEASDLMQLVESKVVNLRGTRDNQDWSADDIDQAAEWLYEQQRWSSWTHYCFVNNLRYGQCVKAYRVAIVRHGLPFTLGFEPLGVVSVVESADDVNDYAYIRFYPHGTVLVPDEVLQ